MLRITIKIDKRTKRPLDCALSEVELGSFRRSYWTTPDEDKPEWIASHSVILSKSLPKDQLTVAVKAITVPTLYVGGIYWYKDRTPPVRPETRMRAFMTEENELACPKCNCSLLTKDGPNEEPVGHSKTLNLPHFICPDCNTYVIVSGRKHDYKEKRNRSGSGISQK